MNGVINTDIFSCNFPLFMQKPGNWLACAGCLRLHIHMYSVIFVIVLWCNCFSMNYLEAIHLTKNKRDLMLDSWAMLLIIESFKMVPLPLILIFECRSTNQSSDSENKLNYIRQSQLISQGISRVYYSPTNQPLDNVSKV